MPALAVPKRKPGLPSSVQVCGFYRRVSPKGDTLPQKISITFFTYSTAALACASLGKQFLAHRSAQQAAAIKRAGAGLDLCQLVAGGETQHDRARARFAK